MKFSFTTFFAIQPMPAARPVRVAASMIVFTSLLSDMVILKKIIFQLEYGGGLFQSSSSSQSLASSETSSFVEMISQAVLQQPLVNSYQIKLIIMKAEILM